MYDSFSQDVKNEICSFRHKNRCCKISLLYGMFFGMNIEQNDRITLENENPSVVILYIKLIKELCSLKNESDISLIDITDERIIQRLNSLFESGSFMLLNDNIFKCEECLRAFIRGAFLTCGTITYPKSSYHMEFLLKDKERASFLCNRLTELGTQPKTVVRHSNFYGVYFKDSENVVDMLGYLGANKAAFKILDVKIYKDIRNNANRLANCETANIGKTVAASEAQIKAIQKIIDNGKADELPSELRQTLDLRAAFPSSTLKDLAQMHTPPITKSGVNHRLKRLLDFSEKI